jgi:Tat protein secretion system quality control protein TatD with DNase activity
MIETDGPFLRPHNAPENAQLFPDTLAAIKKYRRRNEPALLPFVLDQLAELRGQKPPRISKAVFRERATTIWLRRGRLNRQVVQIVIANHPLPILF